MYDVTPVPTKARRTMSVPSRRTAPTVLLPRGRRGRRLSFSRTRLHWLDDALSAHRLHLHQLALNDADQTSAERAQPWQPNRQAVVAGAIALPSMNSSRLELPPRWKRSPGPAAAELMRTGMSDARTQAKNVRPAASPGWDRSTRVVGNASAW
jgi:hypothetical protein